MSHEDEDGKTIPDRRLTDWRLKAVEASTRETAKDIREVREDLVVLKAGMTRIESAILARPEPIGEDTLVRRVEQILERKPAAEAPEKETISGKVAAGLGAAVFLALEIIHQLVNKLIGSGQ